MPKAKGEYVRQARILAVDDDPGCCKLIKMSLGPMGCAVTTANSGKEALEYLQDGQWDLVLLDIGMPGMDGLKVLELIRERFSMDKLPVILVTGQDDPESRSRGLRLRANEFLGKPVDQAELMARIGTILTMRWAQAELEEALKEAEESRKLRDTYLGMAIHDLKGPLTGAKGFMEMALTKLNGFEGAAVEDLRRALGQLDKSIGMIGDVTNLTCLETGNQVTPRCEEMDLDMIVRARMESLEGYAKTMKVSLSVKVDLGLPRVLADRRMVDRILDNLILNAMRQLPGGGRVDVGAGCANGSSSVVVSVHDDGPGASMALRQRVFDSFCQEDLKNLGILVGTGIGLSFCRLAVEAQGGHIWVDSEPAKGTTFHFSLPRADVPAASPH